MLNTGIYYITGNTLFPTQIIVTSELDHTSHLWLNSLSRKATPEMFIQTLEAQNSLPSKEARDFATSITDVMLEANSSLLEALKKGDKNMSLTAYALLGPELRERDSKIEQLQSELNTLNKTISQQGKTINKQDKALDKKG